MLNTCKMLYYKMKIPDF